MGKRTSVALAALVAAGIAAPAAGAAEPLNAYRLKATPKTLEQLALKGYDVGEGKRGGRVEIYATASQIGALRDDGMKARAVGKLRKQAASGAASAALAPPVGSDAPYAVWTRNDAVAADGKDAVRRAVRRARDAADRQEGVARPDAPRPRHLGAEGHQGRQDDRGRHAAGRPLQRHAARARVARGRDLPADARLLRRQLRPDGRCGRPRRRRDPERLGRDGHGARRHARAVVRLRLQPGRLRVHVHARQPPVAQEHARQRQQRRLGAGRRRRPEPQLRDELGPRRGGRVRQPRLRDLSRPGPGLRARDDGDQGPAGPGRLRLPEERPHGGRAAAVAERLPAVHADARQRGLRGARR